MTPDNQHAKAPEVPEAKTQDPSTDVVAADAQVDQAVGVRRGMFGTQGTGDTSGYGGLVAPVVLPGAAQRPYGGWYDEVADALEATIPVDRVVIDRGEGHAAADEHQHVVHQQRRRLELRDVETVEPRRTRHDPV